MAGREIFEAPKPKARPRRQASGESFVWLSGGATIMGVVMIAVLVAMVIYEGARTFWPRDVEAVALGQPRYFLRHAENGNALLDGKDKLVFTATEGFAYADGTPLPPDAPAPRRATIADFRGDGAIFAGFDFELVDMQDKPLLDAAGTPVGPRAFIDRPRDFPSPYAIPDDKGGWTALETALGDDSLRDVAVRMGSVRQTRDLDLRDLPRKDDGTPWKPYEMDEMPGEILLRMGNKVEQLGGSQVHFDWFKTDVPDVAGYRRGNPAGHDKLVLSRAIVPGAIEIERLEKGFLCGFITHVYDNDKPESERLLASLERDGPEGLWKVFQENLEVMRDYHLQRTEVEKDDIGAVNARMKEFERELMRTRFDGRDSGGIVTAMDKLAERYTEWSRAEPLAEKATPEQQHAEAAKLWRVELDKTLAEWEAELGSYGLDAGQIEDLKDVANAQRKRADLQAGEYTMLRLKVTNMQAREAAVTYTFRTLDGKEATLELAHVVRAYKPNDLGVFGRLGVYFSRVHEYLLDDPREANTEGGIFPVIVGTLIMTMLMSIAVVPFGVIAALYLREYAKQGWIVSTVRIAVNNLAGVPSIVFGIFGLGFFCVIMGGTIDSIFFPELLPSPTFGGGGVMWASLTLALLTVPVVIVATEESLVAVPSSQREASLGAGASRWQTIRRVILPQAMPGILTGLILAMARGAGEVAPLMLVGAVKWAPDLPIDGTSPFVHLERKFMHLGFHIYDVGFQSPDVDNTKPLVFTTTLVLIALVALLNIFAIRIRNKIRKRLSSSHV